MKEKVMKKNAIKAYKAFDANWMCRGFRYEVGKTYKMEGEISICNRGFHACEKAADCFGYYPFDPAKIKFAEVLCWGNVEKSDTDSKLCCTMIQIVWAMDWNEVLKVCNTGNWNSGNRNTGNSNTGNWNTGNCNTGNWNTGYWNTGNSNTGNWNTGDWNTGYFNTPELKTFFCFNRPTKKQLIKFPKFLLFDLIEWVPVSDMTAEEKNEHPECDVIGGYLKRHDYKQAFRKSFHAAKKRSDWAVELEKLKAIPNFDYAIFEEISGISKEELEGR